jgi:hypothetical protein
MGTYQGEVQIVVGADKTKVGTKDAPFYTATTSEVGSGSADAAQRVTIADTADIVRSRATATTSGTYTVSTTVESKATNVLGVVVTASDACRVRFLSAATTISPFFHVNENTPLVMPQVEKPSQAWFATATSEGFLVEVDPVDAFITEQVVIYAVTNS